MTTKRMPALRIASITGPTCCLEGPMFGCPAIALHTSNGAAPAIQTDAVMAEIIKRSPLGPGLLSIAGCDPGAELYGPFAEMAQRAGFTVQVRTTGAAPAGWFGAIDFVDICPPPPSSGITTADIALDRTVNYAVTGDAQVSLVFVIEDQADYDYARLIAERYDPLPVFLHPSTTEIVGLYSLMNMVCDDRWYTARVMPTIPLKL